MAEILLLFAIVILSLLIMALGVLAGLLGVISASDLPPKLFASSAVVLVLAGLAGAALCVPPLLKVFGRRGTTSKSAAPLVFESSETANRPERRASGALWSDPPVYFALWMTVVVLTSNVVAFLAFTLVPNEVGNALASAGRISPVTLALGQLPFLVVALCGVGLGVRRNFRETLARLGYGRVTLPQLGIVALFVVGALLLSFAADTLFAALQPDLYERVGEVSEGLFSPEGLSPISAILFALLIGVGAGVGEETLFRGAVQPALGITLTSILFASMHVQYGPSLLLGYLFVISVGLGFLRKHINTTASFAAHASYNTLGVLLAYFFGA
ncbi:MAG: CPBP family intramembrane metalloprotease [Actinomycetota bacterium]|nr:CPBP family intramembrane metalloprotease [Actinomycetota bacterium]